MIARVDHERWSECLPPLPSILPPPRLYPSSSYALQTLALSALFKEESTIAYT